MVWEGLGKGMDGDGYRESRLISDAHMARNVSHLACRITSTEFECHNFRTIVRLHDCRFCKTCTCRNHFDKKSLNARNVVSRTLSTISKAI